MSDPTPPRADPWRAALVAALLGGAGAVAAEVVFTRRLALLFGVTAPAAATVVAVYLAGMALGAALGGRLVDRLGRRAGLVYVVAELFALGWAVAFLPLADAADGVVLSFSSGSDLGLAALAAAVLVGPAAVLSGSTFPALTRLLGQGGAVRRLYAANGGGAAVGGLAAGLWLPPAIGLSGTLWLAGGLSALAGLVMLPAALRGAPEQASPDEGVVEAVPPRLAVAAYAVIGALGMGAEIGWTRLLEQTGPNPGSLAFPVVLVGYLVGLAAGGAVLAPRLRAHGERAALGWSCLAGGVVSAAALGLLVIAPEERLLGHLVGEGPGNVAIFRLTGLQVSADRLAIYLLAAAVPGAASGVGFPVAAAAIARARQGLGRGVGLAGSTGIGAGVLVSLWMGFLPEWGPGVVRSLALLGLASAAVGAALLGRRSAWALALATAAALAVPPWAGLQIPPDEQVLAFVETAAGPSAVARSETETSIYTHGERVGGLRLGLEVPFALHPDPAEVLVIAFGTGVNIVGMLQDPAITSLTCADIDPALPRLARDIPNVGAGVFDGQRARFVADDGRHHLRRQDRRYDVIYSDVATYAQYVELGTVEFFALARSRLAEGGMFALKIHADTLTLDATRRFLATFLEVFPEAGLFGGSGPVPVLVGFTDPPTAEQLQVRGKVADATYGRVVRLRLLRNTLLATSGLRAIAAGPPATDDRPLALRHALVGPLDATAFERSAGFALGPLIAQHGSGAAQELFGTSAGRPHRWEGHKQRLDRRRGWLPW